MPLMLHRNGPWLQSDWYWIPRVARYANGRAIAFRFLNVYVSVWI
jgi:hypothetical protein